MKQAKIETVYRSRLDISDSAYIDKADILTDIAANLATACGAEFEGTGAGPCWNGYMVFEHGSRETLAVLMSDVIAEAKRLRVGVKV